MRYRLTPLALGLLTLLSLLSSPGEAQDSRLAGPDEALAVVPVAVRNALLARDYDEAQSLLAQLDELQPEEAALWGLVRSITWAQRAGAASDAEQAEAWAAAEAAARTALESDASSPWAGKLTYQRADALRALGRMEEAEALYEAAARELRSEARQGRLAEVYLEHARRLSAPRSEDEPGQGDRDLVRARELFGRALELDAPAAAREEALLGRATCSEEAGQWAQAVGDLDAYLAWEGAADRLGARMRRGLARLNAGDAVVARRDLEDALAAEEELSSALAERTRRGIARAWEAAGMRSQARAAWDRYLTQHPTSPRASLALSRRASLFHEEGLREEALTAYEQVLAAARPAADLDEALLREDDQLRQDAWIAMARIRGELGEHQAAGETYARYTQLFPTGAHWSAAQQGIVDSAYQQGVVARAEGDLERARTAWTAFLEGWPLDPRVRSVELALADLHRDAARKAKREGSDQASHLRSALEAYERLVQRHPGSEEASRALLLSGEILERELGDAGRAVETYRRCNFGGSAGEAQARLSNMVAPSLAISTERTWLASETAQVRVQVRNHEQVEVRLFALDLEAYFRKHLSHQRVEDLDLDLIAPDLEVLVPIEGYLPFTPHTQDIEVPVEGPGVWAVVVRAGEERATTLLVRSDLDVLVKSSRQETFLFVQDMQGQRPATGARILLALPGPDGTAQELREVVTGEDGCARLEWPAEAQAQDVRLLVERNGHFASTALQVGQLRLGSEPAARAVIWSDRSAYRPGESISWKAVLRDVRGGRFTPRPGEEVRVRLVDGQGRVLRTQRVPESEFGTADGSFDLPPTAQQGNWRLQAWSAAVGTFQASFKVAQYELAKVELDLESDKAIAYRGESITLTATARWYYGSPVVDAPLDWSLPDGRQVQARTDAKGQAVVTFSTRDFQEDRTLTVQAHLTQEGVHANVATRLAIQGFALEQELPRRILLAGEPFEARIVARAPDGEPTETEVRWTLSRRTTDAGRWREEVVQEGRGTTRAEEPLRLALSTTEGGRHVLRSMATDRFGNEVRREDVLEVSGEDDVQRLRILTETTRFDQGDLASMRLVNRTGSGLALLTVETGRVLEHRLLELEEGVSPLDLELTDAHFPNVRVSVTRMTRGALHEARVALDVDRELTVKVIPKQEVVAPGEEAEVEVLVSDPQGRPVAAEVTLAVVDEALLALHADRTPDLVAVFHQGLRREDELRTESSCTFEYEGETSRISEDVLAETQRLRSLQEWAADREALFEELDALGYVDGLEGAETRSREEVMMGRRKQRAAAPGAPAPMESADDFFLGQGAFNEVIGVGGGAGGKFGGRFGGRRNLRAAGGMARRGEFLDLSGDTLFWSPTIRTDAEGRATVRFEAPDRSTRWRMIARGVTASSLFGGATGALVTRAEVHLELAIPNQVLEGDALAPLGRLHDLTGREGKCVFTLEVETGETRWAQTRTLELAGEPITDLAFTTLDALPPGETTVRLTARMEGAPEVLATVSEVISVAPYGLLFTASEGGRLAEEVQATMELPTGRTYSNRVLRLEVGSGLDRMLLEEALGLGSFWRHNLVDGLEPTHGAARELLGVAAVQERALRAGGLAQEELDELRRRGEGLVAALATQQAGDGGWGPIAGSSNPRSTALVFWALSRAQRASLSLPTGLLDRAASALKAAYSKVDSQDEELRAMIQHALATDGRADFAALNRLHRERARLGPAALAHTTLALVANGSRPMAQELASQLSELGAPAGAGRLAWPTEGNHPWSCSSLEQTALTVLALQAAAPSDPRLPQARAWLEAQRPFGQAKGMVLAALVEDVGPGLPDGVRAEVRLTVAGGRSQVIEVVGGGRPVRLELPLDQVNQRRVELRLEAPGLRGLTWAASLEGFSADLSPTEGSVRGVRVMNPEVLPAPPRIAGRAIPTGFSVLRTYEDRWTNTVQALERGETATLQLRWWRDGRVNEDGHLQLSVPLPAGLVLGSEGVRGGLGESRTEGGFVHVLLDPRATSGVVTLDLLARTTGEWRMLPAVLRSLNEPSRFSLSEAETFRVVPSGTDPQQPYRTTPDELYHGGRAHLEAGNSDRAHASLSALQAEFRDHLHDAILVQSARDLLSLALQRGEDGQVVAMFEILREKADEVTIPFDEIVLVGESYRRLGEHERALLIFRALLLETFGKDLKVAGALEELAQSAASIQLIQDLWLEYPAFDAVMTTHLTLADKLLIKAREASRDESLKAAGWSRAGLVLSATRHLDRFLTLHSSTPLAADAALAMVSARLEVEDHPGAAALADDFARFFPQPRYADAFTYSGAVAKWWLGQETEAEAELGRIVDARYQEDGVTRTSENRSLALYILGQIRHARRDLAGAAEFYDRVDDEFSDAADALRTFREKSIELDEVTRVRPGEPASLSIRHKNLEEAELLVYEVDLLTLYLREKDLSQITRVNLSGIAPTLRTTIDLARDPHARVHEEVTSLALEDPGAYLVIARGEDQFASGLVLISDLELEVTEDATSGRVRVQALQGAGGEYERGVDVRVVGSSDGSIRRGVTDPRGLFVAEGVMGSATVVARLGDDHYAFHRGQISLGAPAQQQLDANFGVDRTEYFKNVIDFNDAQNRGRASFFEEEMKKGRTGVQVLQVK